jgi:uncharacterized protein (DUF1697 family)
MTRYVVLLRGINVGGNKKVSMAELKTLLTGLGYADVRTLLNSGNVVLGAKEKPAALIRALEAAIETELGLSVSVLVRTAAEMRAVVEANPFPEYAAEGSRYVVLFLSAPLDATPQGAARLAEIDPADYAPEQYSLHGTEAYLWHPDGIRDAKMNKIKWDRWFGVVSSARNWNTVVKLADLAASTG